MRSVNKDAHLPRWLITVGHFRFIFAEISRGQYFDDMQPMRRIRVLRNIGEPDSHGNRQFALHHAAQVGEVWAIGKTSTLQSAWDGRERLVVEGKFGIGLNILWPLVIFGAGLVYSVWQVGPRVPGIARFAALTVGFYLIFLLGAYVSIRELKAILQHPDGVSARQTPVPSRLLILDRFRLTIPELTPAEYINSLQPPPYYSVIKHMHDPNEPTQTMFALNRVMERWPDMWAMCEVKSTSHDRHGQPSLIVEGRIGVGFDILWGVVFIIGYVVYDVIRGGLNPGIFLLGILVLLLFYGPTTVFIYTVARKMVHILEEPQPPA